MSTTEALEIRSAAARDVAALAELSEQLGYPSTPREVRERLTRLRRAEDHRVFVAVAADGRLLGWIHAYVALRIESDPFVEIGGLVVREEARGRGLGSRLVAAAEAWARSRGVPKLRVRSRTGRRRAHAFYRRLGFTDAKEQLVLDRQL